MVAHVVLRAARLGDPLLQILVLHRLHGELVIPFRQLQRFVLLQDQPRDDIVDQAGADVDDQQKQRILRPQRDLQTRPGSVAVNSIVPHDIERRRDQPEIAPCKAGGFLLHRGGVDIFNIEKQRDGDDHLDEKQHQRKGPAVALHGERREEQPFGAFCADHREICKVGDHQQGEKGLAGAFFHRGEIKHRV